MVSKINNKFWTCSGTVLEEKLRKRRKTDFIIEARRKEAGRRR